MMICMTTMRHLHHFIRWFPSHLFCFIQFLQLHLIHPHISHIVHIISHGLFFNHLYLHQGSIHPIITSTCSLSWLCHLYVTRISLTHHQTSCNTHMQSSTFEVLMLSTLRSFLPFLAWTWIASLDIINVLHLALPCPHSYHHIPYVLCVEV
jgi:hypothetical protein